MDDGALAELYLAMCGPTAVEAKMIDSLGRTKERLAVLGAFVRSKFSQQDKKGAAPIASGFSSPEQLLGFSSRGPSPAFVSSQPAVLSKNPQRAASTVEKPAATSPSSVIMTPADYEDASDVEEEVEVRKRGDDVGEAQQDDKTRVINKRVTDKDMGIVRPQPVICNDGATPQITGEAARHVVGNALPPQFAGNALPQQIPGDALPPPAVVRRKDGDTKYFCRYECGRSFVRPEIHEAQCKERKRNTDILCEACRRSYQPHTFKHHKCKSKLAEAQKLSTATIMASLPPEFSTPESGESVAVRVQGQKTKRRRTRRNPRQNTTAPAPSFSSFVGLSDDDILSAGETSVTSIRAPDVLLPPQFAFLSPPGSVQPAGQKARSSSIVQTHGRVPYKRASLECKNCFGQFENADGLATHKKFCSSNSNMSQYM